MRVAVLVICVSLFWCVAVLTWNQGEGGTVRAGALLAKPRFVMSVTLILPHNSQNMTYFVTKFGMCKFCMVP